MLLFSQLEFLLVLFYQLPLVADREKEFWKVGHFDWEKPVPMLNNLLFLL